MAFFLNIKFRSGKDDDNDTSTRTRARDTRRHYYYYCVIVIAWEQYGSIKIESFASFHTIFWAVRGSGAGHNQQQHQLKRRKENHLNEMYWPLWQRRIVRVSARKDDYYDGSERSNSRRLRKINCTIQNRFETWLNSRCAVLILFFYFFHCCQEFSFNWMCNERIAVCERFYAIFHLILFCFLSSSASSSEIIYY